MVSAVNKTLDKNTVNKNLGLVRCLHVALDEPAA